MNEENKITPRIQFKVSQEVKDAIHQRAAAANLSVSDFLRTAALSDDKVVFLNESGSIAKALTEINYRILQNESVISYQIVEMPPRKTRAI